MEKRKAIHPQKPHATSCAEVHTHATIHTTQPAILRMPGPADLSACRLRATRTAGIQTRSSIVDT